MYSRGAGISARLRVSLLRTVSELPHVPARVAGEVPCREGSASCPPRPACTRMRSAPVRPVLAEPACSGDAASPGPRPRRRAPRPARSVPPRTRRAGVGSARDGPLPVRDPVRPAGPVDASVEQFRPACPKVYLQSEPAPGHRSSDRSRAPSPAARKDRRGTAGRRKSRETCNGLRLKLDGASI